MAFIPDDRIGKLFELGSAAIQLYAYFCQWRDHQSGKCRKSTLDAKSDLNLSKPTFYAAINQLVNKGWIKIEVGQIEWLAGDFSPMDKSKKRDSKQPDESNFLDCTLPDESKKRDSESLKNETLESKKRDSENSHSLKNETPESKKLDFPYIKEYPAISSNIDSFTIVQESASIENSNSDLPNEQTKPQDVPKIPKRKSTSQGKPVDLNAEQKTSYTALMRKHGQRVGAIPDGAKQGKWLKWLLTHGYTEKQITDEYEAQVNETGMNGWRGKVDFATVANNIGQRIASIQAASNGHNGIKHFTPANDAQRRERMIKNITAKLEREGKYADR